MGDYLDEWDRDWLSRSSCNPELAPRAWQLRDQGFSYAQIAGTLGVTLAAAWQLTEQREAYEQSPDPAGTIGHLMNTVQYELAHAVVHLKAALATDGAERKFNLEHAQSHTESAAEHAGHLHIALSRQYPEIKARYDEVTAAAHLDGT